MYSIRYWTCMFGAVLLLVLGFSGCQALRELTALRQVDFAIDRVDDATLAGVNVQRIRSYDDLSARDLLRVGGALSRNEMPFEFTLILDARNPEDNPSQARMVAMDWTLFLDDNETVSGRFEERVVLPPGEPQEISVPISLDLLEFFDRNARSLVNLALAVAGVEGQSTRIELEALPTIETPVGPIQYPNPIVITPSEVGS